MTPLSLRQLEKNWEWVDITDAIDLVEDKTYEKINSKINTVLSPIEFASWCYRTLQCWQDKKLGFIKVVNGKIYAFTDPVIYSNRRIEKIKKLN